MPETLNNNGIVAVRLDEGKIVCKRNGRATSGEIKFLVKNVANRSSAISAALSVAPEKFEDMPMGNVSFGEWKGEGACTVSVSYSSVSYRFSSDGDDDEAREDAEEPVLNFDSGSGTAHIVRAITQNRFVPGAGWVADDCAGMIGWNGKFGGDCEFAGVDVPTADMRLTYTKRMRVSKVTSTEFMRACASCAGKVNSVKFRGWNPGELLFVNASFQASLGGEKWVMVSFNFRAQPNEEHAIIAGHDTGAKPGWDYYWTTQAEYSTDGVTEQRLTGIYGSQVFKRTDFAVLGF